MIGHGGSTTGLGRVVHSLLPHLSSRFDVHHLATNQATPSPDVPWAVHPNPDPLDVYAARRSAPVVDAVDPELVLLVHDLRTIPFFLEGLARSPGRRPVVAYCPVDGAIRRPEALRWTAAVDALVVYTDFARRQVLACDATLRAADPSRPPIEPVVIPHGTACDLFRPCPPGAAPVARHAGARRTLFGEGTVPDDAFVVLNAGRNQPRKRIDLTVRGFALFARGKDDVYLYLHMGLRELGWDVRALARAAGIERRLLVSTAGDAHPEVDDACLNTVYNACDVGLSTSAGDAWGLVSFEHAATGAAQVVPRHTAYAELWSASAVTVEPVATAAMGSTMQASLVSPEGVAEALELLYRDPGYRQAMARAAYANATQPKYRWSAIASQWTQVLSGVLDRSPTRPR